MREEGQVLRIDVLGVGFDNVTMTQAVEKAGAMIEEGGFHYAVTPNPEFVQLARRDGRFRSALNEADLVLPDGIGVIYAAKILGRPLTARVPGCDFAAALCTWMSINRKRLFLLGAKSGVAMRAAANLKVAHPHLTICGTHDGYFSQDEPVIRAIRESRADVVFVCLGAPKQEYWISRYGGQTGASLLIGLGGSLDVFAGTVKRAPERWQKRGLEWLYRLLQQPSRIGRMAKLPLFLLSAVGARIKGR